MCIRARFYGEYGIQSYDTKLSVRHMSTGFYGCGRWSFSGTVASFDEWTRDWIKNRGPLTQEQYNALLQVMQEKELSILIEFDDNEEGFGLSLIHISRLSTIFFGRRKRVPWVRVSAPLSSIP